MTPQIPTFTAQQVRDEAEELREYLSVRADDAADMLEAFADRLAHEEQWLDAKARLIDSMGGIETPSEAYERGKREVYAEIAKLLTLAREAVNGWAVYAKNERERSNIYTLHQQLDTFQHFTVGPAAPDGVD